MNYWSENATKNVHNSFAFWQISHFFPAGFIAEASSCCRCSRGEGGYHYFPTFYSLEGIAPINYSSIIFLGKQRIFFTTENPLHFISIQNHRLTCWILIFIRKTFTWSISDISLNWIILFPSSQPPTSEIDMFYLPPLTRHLSTIVFSFANVIENQPELMENMSLL